MWLSKVCVKLFFLCILQRGMEYFFISTIIQDSSDTHMNQWNLLIFRIFLYFTFWICLTVKFLWVGFGAILPLHQYLLRWVHGEMTEDSFLVLHNTGWTTLHRILWWPVLKNAKPGKPEKPPKSGPAFNQIYLTLVIWLLGQEINQRHLPFFCSLENTRPDCRTVPTLLCSSA